MTEPKTPLVLRFRNYRIYRYKLHLYTIKKDLKLQSLDTGTKYLSTFCSLQLTVDLSFWIKLIFVIENSFLKTWHLNQLPKFFNLSMKGYKAIIMWIPIDICLLVQIAAYFGNMLTRNMAGILFPKFRWIMAGFLFPKFRWIWLV